MTKLMAIARSRTETASRVERSRMLLAYQDDPSFFAVGRALGAPIQTVRRCVERAVAFGRLAALNDRPRPGKEATITPEAKTWLVSLACRKAKDLGYPHEPWTARLLARRAREHAPAAGRHRLSHLAQGAVSNAAYPASTAIKLILDNHSAHISNETKAWLATQPEGRFILVFTPKHGSWLNLVEGFFSKLTCTVLRQSRVASKREREDRVLAAIEEIN